MSKVGNLDTQFNNLISTQPDVEFVNVTSMNPVGSKRAVYKYHHVTGSAKSNQGYLMDGLNKVLEQLVTRRE